METWSFDKTPLFHAKFCSLSKTRDCKVIAEIEINDGTKDKDGKLWFYSHKPKRLQVSWASDGNAYQAIIDENLFPNLTWADKPIEVEIIKKK